MSRTNLQTTKSKVEWCLQNRPATRGDDLMLMLSVWKNFYRQEFECFIKMCLQSMELTVPDCLVHASKRFENLPSSESCRRVRQKFNQQDMYLPDPKTVKGRGRKRQHVLEFVRENIDQCY